MSSAIGGNVDQTATAGSHTASGSANGSLDAQHARGSTAANATGTAGGTLN
jgi:hypothetical protein